MLVNGWTVGHCTTCLNQATETLETATVIIDREFFFKEKSFLVSRIGLLWLHPSRGSITATRARLIHLGGPGNTFPHE